MSSTSCGSASAARPSPSSGGVCAIIRTSRYLADLHAAEEMVDHSVRKATLISQPTGPSDMPGSSQHSDGTNASRTASTAVSKLP